MIYNYDFWLLPLASDWVDRHSRVHGVHCFPVFPLFVSVKLECCEIYRSLSTHVALSVRASSARASRVPRHRAPCITLAPDTQAIECVYPYFQTFYIFFLNFQAERHVWFWRRCCYSKQWNSFPLQESFPSHQVRSTFLCTLTGLHLLWMLKRKKLHSFVVLATI